MWSLPGRRTFQLALASSTPLLFPALSFLLTVLVTISFAVPLWATGALERAADGGVDVVTAVLAFLYYFVTYTVIIFCNAALVGAP